MERAATGQWQSAESARFLSARGEIEVPGKWTGVTDLRFTLHSRDNANNQMIEDRCTLNLGQIKFSGWQEFWARILGRDLVVTVTYNTDAGQCGSDPPAKTAGN